MKIKEVVAIALANFLVLALLEFELFKDDLPFFVGDIYEENYTWSPNISNVCVSSF